MLGPIVQLQLRTWLRDGRLRALLGAMALLLIAASGWATAADIARRHAQQEAAEQARTQWLERGAQHPHGRAHFGDFAFRPSGPLARMDRGVQAQLGKVLRIEAHRQGTPLHSDAAQAGTVARFPRPDAAFLLQSVLPLLLIFLGATGLAADREDGRLRLALVQGARARALAAAHVLALWGLGLALLGLVVVVSLGTSVVLDGAPVVDGARLLGFIGVHALFLFVVAAAVVTVSLWIRTARGTLLTLLAVWVVTTALLPRAAASGANALYPLPSQDEFQAAMRASRAAGPDGHNAFDAKLEERKKALLDKYGVQTPEELPIDWGGIAMQMDEDFGAQVWDRHYGALREQFARQGGVMTGIALLNPVMAVDQASMAFTGTDLAHDLHFQIEAEAYRRDLVRALNHKHAYGAPEDRSKPWKASSEFFASLETFEYMAPGSLAVLQRRAPELLALTVWALALILVARIGADRMEANP